MQEKMLAFAPHSGTVKSAVILLHGYGSNARDLLELAPELAPHLPDTIFLAPDAIAPCEMSGPGFQWFSLSDRREAAMWGGIVQAAPQLNAMIAHVAEEYDLPYEKIALLGFSQGAMMAMHVAPRLTAPLAGVVAFSGALVGGLNLARETRARPPMLLVHGVADEVVPYLALTASAAALTLNGFRVETETRPRLGHSIDAEGLAHARTFLQTALN